MLLRVGLLGINRAYSIGVQQMVSATMIFWQDVIVMLGLGIVHLMREGITS